MFTAQLASNNNMEQQHPLRFLCDISHLLLSKENRGGDGDEEKGQNRERSVDIFRRDKFLNRKIPFCFFGLFVCCKDSISSQFAARCVPFRFALLWCDAVALAMSVQLLAPLLPPPPLHPNLKFSCSPICHNTFLFRN